jgi:hypothetical protein
VGGYRGREEADGERQGEYRPWPNSKSEMTSLDHLIRPVEGGLGNGEPEGLGGLEVDDQLKLGRLRQKPSMGTRLAAGSGQRDR